MKHDTLVYTADDVESIKSYPLFKRVSQRGQPLPYCRGNQKEDLIAWCLEEAHKKHPEMDVVFLMVLYHDKKKWKTTTLNKSMHLNSHYFTIMSFWKQTLSTNQQVSSCLTGCWGPGPPNESLGNGHGQRFLLRKRGYILRSQKMAAEKNPIPRTHPQHHSKGLWVKPSLHASYAYIYWYIHHIYIYILYIQCVYACSRSSCVDRIWLWLCKDTLSK